MEVADASTCIHVSISLPLSLRSVSNPVIRVNIRSILSIFKDNKIPMNKNYQLGLLYLVHLLVSADGVVDEKELAALDKIKSREKIPNDIFGQFKIDITIKKERDIYQAGLEYLSQCTNEERLQAFAILYKMSEVDGRVHVKE